MLDEKFVLVGLAIGSVGTISYLISTLKGETKPNKVSWLFWAIAPLIAFYAEIKQGVGLQSLLTFSVGFGPLLIFFASFVNKKAEWKISTLDIICGTLAMIGIILWLITKIGNLAILFSVLADGLAAIPTLVKSFKYPETENGAAFSFAGINAMFTLATIKSWTFARSAFPIYIFLIDIVLFSLIQFKLGTKLKKYFLDH